MNDFLQKKASLLTTLRSRHISYVRVMYNGSGDDGSVQEITVRVDGEMLTVDEAVRRFEESQPGVARAVADRLLNVAGLTSSDVEDFAYAALDAANVDDWVNNDGGGGMLHIYVDSIPPETELPPEVMNPDGTVKAGTVHAEHYINIQTQQHSDHVL